MKAIFYILSMSIIFEFCYSKIPPIDIKMNEQFGVEDFLNNDEACIEKEKSPLLAMALSGFVPGLGEIYMEKIPRAIVFGMIEVFAWTKFFEKQKLGDEYTIDYQLYAQDHWSFAQWTSNYYNWDDEENEYYSVFSNDVSGYFDIWGDSHHINFRWGDQQTIVSSSSNTFESIYTENELWNIDSANSFVEFNNVEVEYDHHFYENIGKYDHFYAGWDDSADSIFVVTNSYGVQNAFSPNKKYYQQTLRTRANDTYEMAEVALKGILANHVVSMLDALILAKLWNNKRGYNISANTYYDHRNSWGVGGITLSVRW